MDSKTTARSRTAGATKGGERRPAPRRTTGRSGRVPAWRDPQRMLGGLVLQAVGGGLLLAIGSVWQDLHVAIGWH